MYQAWRKANNFDDGESEACAWLIEGEKEPSARRTSLLRRRTTTTSGSWDGRLMPPLKRRKISVPENNGADLIVLEHRPKRIKPISSRSRSRIGKKDEQTHLESEDDVSETSQPTLRRRASIACRRLLNSSNKKTILSEKTCDDIPSPECNGRNPRKRSFSQAFKDQTKKFQRWFEFEDDEAQSKVTKEGLNDTNNDQKGKKNDWLSTWDTWAIAMTYGAMI